MSRLPKANPGHRLNQELNYGLVSMAELRIVDIDTRVPVTRRPRRVARCSVARCPQA